MDVNLVVAPRSQATTTLDVDNWPTPAEAEELTAEAALRLTSGKRIDVSVGIELESEVMYDRDNILEDLL